jgi:hypothetical protein
MRGLPFISPSFVARCSLIAGTSPSGQTGRSKERLSTTFGSSYDFPPFGRGIGPAGNGGGLAVAVRLTQATDGLSCGAAVSLENENANAAISVQVNNNEIKNDLFIIASLFSSSYAA